MTIRFLLDENLAPALKQAVLSLEPEIDIARVGDEGVPGFGTLDPDILIYLEQSQRILVTDNRKSMPQHLRDHFAEGRVHYGILWLRDKNNHSANAETLHIIWGASEIDEWLNVIQSLPL